MKKILKQLGSIVLCAAVCAGIGGCGAKTGDGEVTKVTVWTGNGHDKAFLNERISKWNETEGKKKNVYIDYVVQEGKMAEKLKLVFDTDQAPDLFTGASLKEYVEKEYILAFDDLPGVEGIIDEYKAYAMPGRVQYDGKYYSLPKSVTTYGIIYNKEMFKAAGIVDEKGEPTPPETLEELREYAKKLTNPEKKEYGIIFPGKFGAWFNDDVEKMASASCGFVDGYDPKTGKYDFSADAAVMKTLLGIKEDGSCYPGVEGMENDPARARFGAGGVGMKTAASYDYGVLTDQFPATIDWGVAPFPVLDKDNKCVQHMGAYGYLYINKKSAETKAEALAEVLNFFYDDELVKDSYKAGIDLPSNWDLVKDIKLDDKMAQWKQFAELTQISQGSPTPIAADMQGERHISRLWIEEIWAGNVKVDALDDYIKAYTDKTNEGIAVYKQDHPNYDGSQYIISDWNSKREEK